MDAENNVTPIQLIMGILSIYAGYESIYHQYPVLNIVAPFGWGKKIKGVSKFDFL